MAKERLDQLMGTEQGMISCGENTYYFGQWYKYSKVCWDHEGLKGIFFQETVIGGCYLRLNELISKSTSDARGKKSVLLC